MEALRDYCAKSPWIFRWHIDLFTHLSEWQSWIFWVLAIVISTLRVSTIKNDHTCMNIVPSLRVRGIAPCTWQTFETKYVDKLRIGFRPSKDNFSIAKAVARQPEDQLWASNFALITSKRKKRIPSSLSNQHSVILLSMLGINGVDKSQVSCLTLNFCLPTQYHNFIGNRNPHSTFNKSVSFSWKVLWVVPIEWLRWLLVMLGMCLSGKVTSSA